MMVPFSSKLFLVFGIVIAYFIVTSLYGFYISVRPTKYTTSYTPDTLGLSYEAASFAAADGVELSGWFIPVRAAAEKTAKTIILLHGYPADKGDVLPSLAFLHETYNLLLFDFRYLGESSGAYSTAGAREVKDLRAALAFLKERGITEAGVYGFSMGGAVALMGAAEMPEIKAVVSEGSYARLDLLARDLYRIPILDRPLGWMTLLWAKLFLGIDAKNVSPEDAARKLTIPVFIIHSQSDEVVRAIHAHRLREALNDNRRAEFWLPERLVHGERSAEHKKRIGDFFAKSL